MQGTRFSRVLPTPHMGYHASKLIEGVVYCLSKSLGEFGIRPTVYSFRITKCLTQNLIIRVHTNFCIQNSKNFPDFFQNNTIFFQTQGWQIGDQQRPWKMQDPSFFMMNCKHTCTITTVQCRHKRTMKLLILWLNVLATGETELDLNTGKKYSLINHLTYCSFEKKKKIRPLTILPDFFQVWKIAGQTLDLFENSRLRTNPVMKRGKSKGEAVGAHLPIFSQNQQLTVLHFGQSLAHFQEELSLLQNIRTKWTSVAATVLTLAVWSFEAVTNIVWSLYIWISLICLECSCTVNSLFPVWEMKKDMVVPFAQLCWVCSWIQVYISPNQCQSQLFM